MGHLAYISSKTPLKPIPTSQDLGCTSQMTVPITPTITSTNITNMHLVVHSPATPPALSKHASGGLPHWPLHLHQNINLLIRHSGSISSYLIHCHKSHPWDSVVRHRAYIHWTSRKWLAHCLLGGIHSLAHHNLMLPQHEIYKCGATSSSQSPFACHQRAGASSTGQTHYHVC